MQTTVHIARQRRFDVVVCGGGTAGFCAAIAAARCGAKTAVLERFGMLGGTMTVGGVQVLFHHTAADVQAENGHVTAVLAAGPEGSAWRPMCLSIAAATDCPARLPTRSLSLCRNCSQPRSTLF